MTTTNKLAKEFGRQAFGRDPAAYHNARPDYPEWVYEILTSRCGLRPNAAVFEIGPGTGTATHRLLELGADPLVAIEPDQRLADFLRANNPGKALDIVVTPFESATLEEKAFDLGMSATAFHWLDEDAALTKVASLLKPGAWWAVVWNVFGDDSRPDPFHEETKAQLKAFTSPSAGERGIPFGLDAEARIGALQRTEAFDVVEHRTSQWSLPLNADETMALYATYSDVNARPDREELLSEIGRIAREEFKDHVVRNMTTSLYIARRAS